MTKDYWLHYDHQGGRWCVEEVPPKVIRTGAEVIHVRTVEADYRPIEARILLMESLALITELEGYEGAEGYPDGLRQQMQGFQTSVKAFLTNTEPKEKTEHDIAIAFNHWLLAYNLESDIVSHPKTRALAWAAFMAGLKERTNGS